jgi:hypothetical protein
LIGLGSCISTRSFGSFPWIDVNMVQPNERQTGWSCPRIVDSAAGDLCAVAVLATVALSGCLGGEGSSRERDVPKLDAAGITDTRLLAHVSAVLRARPVVEDPEGWGGALAYADLVAARKQLGLPSDASLSGSVERRLLRALATRPLFRFSTLVIGRPSLGPLADVLDERRIALVVGTNFAFSGPGADEITAWDVLVLGTRQPSARSRACSGVEATNKRRAASWSPTGLLRGLAYTRAPFRSPPSGMEAGAS